MLKITKVYETETVSCHRQVGERDRLNCDHRAASYTAAFSCYRMACSS